MGRSVFKFLSALSNQLNALPAAPSEKTESPPDICPIELEERVLYNASPFVVAGIGVSGSDTSPTMEIADLGSLSDYFVEPTDNINIWYDGSTDNSLEKELSQGSQASDVAASDDLTGHISFDGDGGSVSDPDHLIEEVGSGDNTGQEIVFIDANVDDWQQLLDDLRLTEDRGRNLNVVMLDSSRDGIEQISDSLANYQDVTAIHLVSHGNVNQLNLGATTLTNQNLLGYAGEIADWRGSLAEGADVLIYGCNLASSEDGRALIEGLGALCDCDVAASDDLSGYELLGGDWDLEYHIGEIEHSVVFSLAFQRSWEYLLPTWPSSDGENSTWEYITNVSFVTINNSTGVDPGGYGDYTGQSATVVQGESNDLTVTISAATQEYVNAWIDWNIDGDFDDVNEAYVLATNTSSDGPHTISIVTPNDATIGTTLMRVSVKYGGPPPSTGSYQYGEVEDYTVVITGSGNDAPTISSIGNQSTAEDTSTGAMAFTVGDTETAAGSLIVTATSDDQTLIPDGNIILGGSGANRTIEILPASNQFGGPATITVTVDDGTTTTQTTFDIAVTPVNDAPTATIVASAFGIDEDDPFRPFGGFSVSDIDAGFGDLAVRLTVNNGVINLTGTSGLTFVGGANDSAYLAFTGNLVDLNNALSTFTYHPNLNFNGTDIVAISVDDLGNTGGGALSDTDTANIIVTPVNDDPIANDDSGAGFTTDEDTGFTTLNVLSNDNDVDIGDVISLNSVNTSGMLGSLIDNGDGTFDYDPNGQFEYLAVGESATDNFSYTIDDGNGATDTATVFVTINGANDAPTADNDSTSIGEDFGATDITAALLAGDTDPDTNDTLGITALDTTGTVGTVSLVAGVVAYDPDGKFDYLAVGQTVMDSFSYTVDDGNGGIDTATMTVSISGANDAPVLATSGSPTLADINEGDTLNSGDLVSAIIASAGGDPVTDADASPQEGIAVTAVDDSNGTWEYSIDGGSIWTPFGAVSDNSAVVLTDTLLDRVRFVPVTNFNGTASFDYRAWDRTDALSSGTTGVNVAVNGGAESFSVATESASINVIAVKIVWFLSTEEDVTLSGVAGLDNWTAGELLSMGDPNLAFEPGTTNGTFASAFNLDTFTLDGDADITAFHQVSGDITLGGNAFPSIDLFVGDLLMVADVDGETFTGSDLNSITPDRTDVFVFRPDVPGDYSNGTFFILLDNLPGDYTTGISLVEQDTWVGDAFLQEGSFIFNAGIGNKIRHFVADDVGNGTTIGSVSMLIDGSDIGMGGGGINIEAIDLIETDLNIGGVSLTSGQILVTLSADDGSVGDNMIATKSTDIFYLDVTTTGTGTTSADAIVLFDGLDVGLDTGAEAITALGFEIRFGGGNQDPVITLPGGSVSYLEDDPATVIDGAITFSDLDTIDFSSGQLNVDFTGGATIYDVLGINHQGFTSGLVGVLGNVVSYGGTTIATMTGGSSLVPLVVTFNSSATQVAIQAVMRNVTFDNVSESPDETARTVRFEVTDGNGGTSNVETEFINVARENDTPTAINISNNLFDENIDTTGGILVGNLTTIDTDSPESFSYAIVGGTDMAAFAIGGTSFDELRFDESLIGDGLIDFEDKSIYTVDVEVTDIGGAKFVETIAINVNDLNEAPIVSDQSFPIDENTGNGTVVGNILAADFDGGVNGNLTFNLTGGSGFTAFVVNSSGQIAVADTSQLDFETTTSFTLDVEVTDGGTPGLTDTATITINVNDLNEVPVVNDQAFPIDENVGNGTVVGNIAATDWDAGVDGNLTFSAISGTGVLAFNVDSAGQITVADNSLLDFETNPSFTLNVLVTDGGTPGLTDTATITINLADLNEAPVITSDGGLPTAAINVSENITAVTFVAATDEDVPADSLNYAISGGADSSDFTINALTGELEFLTSKDFETFEDTNSDGVYEVQVTVDDGILSDVQDISVTVTNGNEAPTTTGVPDLTINEDNTPLGFMLSSVFFDAEDASSDLVYTVQGNTNAGLFSSATINPFLDRINLVFAADQNGIADITVRGTDSGGLFVESTFRVTINPLNDDPFLDIPVVPIVVNEDAADTVIDLSLVFDDVDIFTNGDVLSYSLVSNSNSGLVATLFAGNNVTLDYLADQFGSANIIVRATDLAGRSVTETIDVTVSSVNDVPIANDQVFAINENSIVGTSIGFIAAGPGLGDVLAGDSITNFSIAGGTGIGIFAVNSLTGEITVLDDLPLDFETSPSFTLDVQVTDAGAPGLTDTATITINLTDLNEVPVLNDQAFPINENSGNGTVVGNIVAADLDAGLNGNLTFNLTGGTGFTAFAVDTAGQITVVDATQLDFETTPSFALDVVVTDGGTPALTDTATITVNLNDLVESGNNIPIVNDQSFAIDENSGNGTIVGSIVATDPDSGLNGDLTFSLMGGTGATAFNVDSIGNITVADGTQLDFETTTSFTLNVEVMDGGTPGLTDMATITIDLNDLGDAAPVLGTNQLILDEGDAIVLNISNLAATDVDSSDPGLVMTVNSVVGGQFEFAIAPGVGITSFTQGQVIANEIIFVDNGDEFAPSYDVTVDDGVLSDGPHAANVFFTNVNDAPIGTGDSYSVLSDDTLSGTGLLANDYDADGDSINAIIDALPSSGTVTINPDGSFLYTPDPAFSGADSFTYVVNDGTVDSAPITVIVNVSVPTPPPSIDPPVVDPDEEEIEEDDEEVVESPIESKPGEENTADTPAEKSKIRLRTFTPQESFEFKRPVYAEAENGSELTLVWHGLANETNHGSIQSLIARGFAALDDEFFKTDGWFWRELDRNSHQLETNAMLPEILLGTSAALTSGVSVGFLVWIIKGGQISAMVLANLPAWRWIDPLPILNSISNLEEEGDSLESIIENGNEEARHGIT